MRTIFILLLIILAVGQLVFGAEKVVQLEVSGGRN
jgi:Sec-independent protein translocase protein TatA